MIVGEDFYSWNPVYFQFEDPETLEYIGTAIGNFPLEEQLNIIRDEGTRYKTDILDLGEQEMQIIDDRSRKFREITKLNKDAMRDIVTFFGGVFVLDSSMLDSSPLG